MKDLIDRQATIEALGERPRFSTGGGYEMGVKEQYDRDLLAIINMPPAQPERMQGKWIDDGDPLMWECGCCGYRVKRYNNTRYCPNCGADMRGDADE